MIEENEKVELPLDGQLFFVFDKNGSIGEVHVVDMDFSNEEFK